MSDDPLAEKKAEIAKRREEIERRKAELAKLKEENELKDKEDKIKELAQRKEELLEKKKEIAARMKENEKAKEELNTTSSSEGLISPPFPPTLLNRCSSALCLLAIRTIAQYPSSITIRY